MNRLLVCAAVWLVAKTSARSENAQPQAFFEKHCTDCHDADEKKGGLDLTALKADFTDAENFARWVKVHDVIASGEMPPKKKERPPADEVKAMTGWLGGQLSTASLERQKADGRVASRRLNRTEYENTLRELFGVSVLVKELLPEDSSSRGFDTVASALTVSPAHLVAYQRAADAALDAVIASSTRRELHESFTGREWFEREVKGNRKQVPHGAAVEGEMAVLYHQTTQHWELNVMPREAAKTPGIYRVRLTAAARNTGGKPLPVRFGWEWMMASTDLRHIVAYRDVPAGKPTTMEVFFELTGRRSEHRLGVCGYTLPGLPDDKEPLADWSSAPGIEIHRFEIEGPLGEWPSAGHKALFGDLPLEPRSFAEARAAGKPVPTDDWQKWQPEQFKNNPLVPVTNDPKEDAERLIRAFLPRAFRGPVSDATASYFVMFSHERLARGVPFAEAMRSTYKAALCSPYFLFQLAPPGPLSDHALATRLAYFLWSGPPDAALLADAARGGLRQPKTLRAQVERMLADARAEALVENFASQWLDLRKVLTMKPDEQYLEYDDELGWSLAAETKGFFREVLARDRSVTEFVDSDWTMLNARLAKHYGIPGVDGCEFRKVPLIPAYHRGGVITHASILKATANGTYTSPIKRGVWMLERIIGRPPSPPPPDTPAIEPDIRGATTLREQIEKHRALPACTGCHAKIDPPGFALESYDVLGGWRERYRSPLGLDGGKSALLPLPNYPEKKHVYFTAAVDPSGITSEGAAFADLVEYKRALLRDPAQIARNVARKLLDYGTGADIQFADREVLEQILTAAKPSNYGLRTLIAELVQSRAFLNQ